MQIKENIKAPRHWPLCREFTGDRWIPRTRASNAGSVSIWWRHHVSMISHFLRMLLSFEMVRAVNDLMLRDMFRSFLVWLRTMVEHYLATMIALPLNNNIFPVANGISYYIHAFMSTSCPIAIGVIMSRCAADYIISTCSITTACAFISAVRNIHGVMQFNIIIVNAPTDRANSHRREFQLVIFGFWLKLFRHHQPLYTTKGHKSLNHYWLR